MGMKEKENLNIGTKALHTMVDTNPNISVIILHISRLNVAIKRQRLSEFKNFQEIYLKDKELKF